MVRLDKNSTLFCNGRILEHLYNDTIVFLIKTMADIKTLMGCCMISVVYTIVFYESIISTFLFEVLCYHCILIVFNALYHDRIF